MASLTGCIKKAGKALSEDDKAAILKAAQEHRADGMKATEAGRKAIADLLEAVRAELAAAEVDATGQPAQNGGYETDLFGNPLPEAQRTSRRARPAAPSRAAAPGVGT